MKLKALVLLILILASYACFGQTFMIVAIEILDGEELRRPFASQEGMIEGMFDSGFVSFDTGLYAPAVDWADLDFREPLHIARQGLAQYLLAAEVRSISERRDLPAHQNGDSESRPEPALKIETFVRYYLFDATTAAVLGEGEFVMDNESPEMQHLTYTQFLHATGREITARGIDLMKQTARNR